MESAIRQYRVDASVRAARVVVGVAAAVCVIVSLRKAWELCGSARMSTPLVLRDEEGGVTNLESLEQVPVGKKFVNEDTSEVLQRVSMAV